MTRSCVRESPSVRVCNWPNGLRLLHPALRACCQRGTLVRDTRPRHAAGRASCATSSPSTRASPCTARWAPCWRWPPWVTPSRTPATTRARRAVVDNIVHMHAWLLTCQGCLRRRGGMPLLCTCPGIFRSNGTEHSQGMHSSASISQCMRGSLIPAARGCYTVLASSFNTGANTVSLCVKPLLSGCSRFASPSRAQLWAAAYPGQPQPTLGQLWSSEVAITGDHVASSQCAAVAAPLVGLCDRLGCPQCAFRNCADGIRSASRVG